MAASDRSVVGRWIARREGFVELLVDLVPLLRRVAHVFRTGGTNRRWNPAGLVPVLRCVHRLAEGRLFPLFGIGGHSCLHGPSFSGLMPLRPSSSSPAEAENARFAELSPPFDGIWPDPRRTAHLLLW